MTDDYNFDSSRLHNIYGCLKYTMCLVNLAIFICGSVLLGLGVWIKLGNESFLKILGSYSVHFQGTVVLCIVVGCVMCIVGFLGCCAAYMENQCLLCIFQILMLLFIFIAITATVLILDYGRLLESILKDKGMTSLKEIYYTNEDKGVITETWNVIMKKLHCCGFFGYSDFESSTFSEKTGLVYPRSCCLDPYLIQCDGTNITEQVIYMQGCYPVILEKVKNNIRSLGIAAAFVTGMVLSSTIVALVLFVKLGDHIAATRRHSPSSRRVFS